MTPGELLHNFHFLRPAYLLILPVLWALIFWLARRSDQGRDWSALIDAELLPALRLEADSAARPWALLTLAWSVAAIALAGPSWQQNQTVAYRASSAWVFVLDLSASMAATDITPDRVTRARYALDDLLGAARDARVALLVFSDDAYTVTPLTQDINTVRTLLPPLSPAIMPAQGDHLAPALVQAGRMLKQSGAKDQRIILLTDGFDDPAAAFSNAAGLKSHGTTLTVLGVGTTGGSPVTDSSGRFVADANGHTEVTRLDSDPLRQLAKAGGGHYFKLADLPALIAALQTRPITAGNEAAGVGVNSWRDSGAYLLPVILLLAAFLGRRL